MKMSIESRRKKDMEYYYTNHDKMLAKNREYYRKNRQYFLDKQKERHLLHGDEIRAKAREKQKENPRRYRGKRLWDCYKITIEQYDKMFENQSGLCAICGLPETTKTKGTLRKLFVDHDHSTGKVRGLLCHACNSAIGLFKEKNETMENAIKYLNDWRNTNA